MQLLSRIIGQDVRRPDGRLVGRIADVTASLAERTGPTLIDRVLVRRRGALDFLAPWSAIELQHNSLTLTEEPDAFTIRSISEALDTDEILLVRDVLDTQIIDVAGQRLARVADVVLARTPDGRLEIVGAEVGFGAVLRRLGLTRLAARTGPDAVAWTDLHLTSERGHAVQLHTPRSAVHLLDARSLAVLISHLDTDAASEVLASKAPNVAADVVRVSHPLVAERVLRALPEAHASNIVATLPAESARHWRDRLAHTPALRGRRLLRSHVWPHRRHHPRGVAR